MPPETAAAVTGVTMVSTSSTRRVPPTRVVVGVGTAVTLLLAFALVAATGLAPGHVEATTVTMIRLHACVKPLQPLPHHHDNVQKHVQRH